MTDPKIDLNFAPLAVENIARINSVRLVRDGSEVAPATLEKSNDGEPEVVLLPVAGGGSHRPRPLFKLESPFGIPSWDLVHAREGFAVVWSKPGSAISRLGYRGPDGKEVVLTGHYPAGVFQNPRFVRGTPEGAPAVIALAYEGSGRVLALFSSTLESGNATYEALPSIGTGLLQDGLLLKTATGYLLFARLLPPGPRASERKDARGESIQPGVLRCVLLNAKLEATGSVVSPVGDDTVYEFDSDLSGGRVFLLAASLKGYVAASTTVSGGDLRWTTSAIPERAELTSPSVIGEANAFRAAVLEASTTPQKQILMGRY